ncbi:diguanylate cyclase [Methylobacterium sp. A54F]
MQLHTPTLLLATSVVTAMVGTLFLLSWGQSRRDWSLAIWGVAHLVGAAASTLLGLRGGIPDWLSVGVANAVMIGGYGLIWSGVRAFEGRSWRLDVALAGGALWSVLCLVPDFYASLPARVILASAAAGLYCAAGGFEIWHGRREALVSRYPAMVVLAAYAACYLLRIPAVIVVPLPAGESLMTSSWIAVTCFTAMLFTIALAFIFMALTKERAEREQRLAAETDPLTGVMNRRAFVAGAEALLAASNRPVALLLFDLDHFKGINDAYGHAVGDGVLIGFCQVARALLPADALIGRIGGEEFACALPDRAPRAALSAAAGVQGAFAGVCLPDLPRLRVGVSVGVASRPAGEIDFDALMRAADGALYRAKRNGRNRVEAADASLDRAA